MTAPPLTAGRPLRVLLIEDSPDDAALMLEALTAGGYAPRAQRVERANAVQAALSENDWDVVLSDHNLPQLDGQEALELRKVHAPELPFIVVSGCIGEEAAVALMRAGADDYIMKDNLARLVPAVRRCVKETHNRRQRQLALLALHESEARYRAIVSNIPGMVFQMLQLPGAGLQFRYASDGCHALLGVPAADLLREPELFLERIELEDRAGFHASMAHSAQRLTAWNWEGRISLYGGEIKWINLRSTPRALTGGGVQWGGVIANISHGKATELELRESRERLRELSAHLHTVKERERTRIAREIHDDLGGTLTAIKIELLRLKRQLPAGYEQLLGLAGSIEALADTALEATRRIATELRPGILDLGLIAAVEWQAREFRKHVGIACELTCTGEEVVLDADAAVALFRIFQEALTNVAKHAAASRVEVRLHFGAADIELTIRDDGRGIAAPDLSKPRSFGIRGILERARELGGEAAVRRAAGAGTMLMVRIPAPAAQPTDSTAQLALFGSLTVLPRNLRD